MLHLNLKNPSNLLLPQQFEIVSCPKIKLSELKIFSDFGSWSKYIGDDWCRIHNRLLSNFSSATAVKFKHDSDNE